MKYNMDYKILERHFILHFLFLRLLLSLVLNKTLIYYKIFYDAVFNKKEASESVKSQN